MEYQVSSREYLYRAKSRLAEGTNESLFYAAFELRCGIEARMQEYLNAWSHISKKKKKGWQIAALGRNIENAFKTGNRIVRWAVLSQETEKLIVSYYYTPVSENIKKAAEELGNYMHSMKIYKNTSDPFWLDFRNKLDDIYKKLLAANTGTLLGPPLIKAGTTKVDMNIELPPNVNSKDLIDTIIKQGRVIIDVSYLTQLPDVLEEEAQVWDMSD